MICAHGPPLSSVVRRDPAEDATEEPGREQLVHSQMGVTRDQTPSRMPRKVMVYSLRALRPVGVRAMEVPEDGPVSFFSVVK